MVGVRCVCGASPTRELGDDGEGLFWITLPTRGAFFSASAAVVFVAGLFVSVPEATLRAFLHICAASDVIMPMMQHGQAACEMCVFAGHKHWCGTVLSVHADLCWPSQAC